MNCARKHTLVTGCSSGIGRATALRLARAGQHVYAGVRKPADGDRLARSGAGEGGEITPVILDVTEPGHIAAVAAAIDEHTGPAGLDGLVNNAGYGLACPAEVVPLDAFRRQLDVNVTFSAMLRVMERREANGSPPDVAAATSSGCPRRVPSPPDPGGAGQQPGRWPPPPPSPPWPKRPPNRM
jgi:NAD(P)-dependent dehydrogenase (short-subunit alcohol dehydrogenase family)